MNHCWLMFCKIGGGWLLSPVQIWSVKQDTCLHDFREHAKVQHISLYIHILTSLLFDSCNRMTHQLITLFNFLGDLYHQMESMWPWYKQPKSTVVAGKVIMLTLRDFSVIKALLPQMILCMIYCFYHSCLSLGNLKALLPIISRPMIVL